MENNQIKTDEKLRLGRGYGALYGSYVDDLVKNYGHRYNFWKDKFKGELEFLETMKIIGNALTVKTGNEHLDEQLKTIINVYGQIPKLYQVLNEDETQQFRKISSKELEKKVAGRLKLTKFASPSLAHFYAISPETPSGPYFDQIEEYCTKIGRNNYKKIYGQY